MLQLNGSIIVESKRNVAKRKYIDICDMIDRIIEVVMVHNCHLESFVGFSRGQISRRIIFVVYIIKYHTNRRSF